MDWSHKNKLFLSSAFVLVVVAAIFGGAHGDAMVSGTVFCDQCKDGKLSIFDYPIHGIKVEVTCTDNKGQVTMKREETTNWLGNYAMKFDGAPDLSSCHAQVSGTGTGPSTCGIASGAVQTPKLMFRMFDMEMYTVDSLLTQPPKPMSFCPRSANPVPGPANPAPGYANPVPGPAIPVPKPVTPAPHFGVTPPAPQFRVPPMPHFPPLPPMPKLPPLPPLPPLPRMPPLPFMEASACSHQNWTAPEYRCHWTGLNPDMKVGVVFGTLAARRYGTDMTLFQGMFGRGDPYRTLLREGITALLNSYHSVYFQYNPLLVMQDFNWALMGSQRKVLMTALRFMRANSGSTTVTCKLKRCT